MLSMISCRRAVLSRRGRRCADAVDADAISFSLILDCEVTYCEHLKVHKESKEDKEDTHEAAREFICDVAHDKKKLIELT